MSREDTWTNQDGLVVGYGTRDTESKSGSSSSTVGSKGELVVDFDLTNPYGGDDDISSDTSRAYLPRNAAIQSVRLYQTDSYDVTADTFTIDVGLWNLAGDTAIDADGLIDGASQLHVDAGRTFFVGAAAVTPTQAGVLIGTITSLESQVGISVASGTANGGKIRVVIEYVRSGA